MALFWPGGRAYGDSAEDPAFGSYDSNHLLDSILDKLHLPDDAALCEALDVDASVISDLRDLRREVDAALLIRMHELTDISIAGLRNILGDRRRKARFAGEDEQGQAQVREIGVAVNDSSHDHDGEPGKPQQPVKPDSPGQAVPPPREISRKEVDHQTPADADPDDPVSP